jgi:hypothetical protein
MSEVLILEFADGTVGVPQPTRMQWQTALGTYHA